MKQHKNIWNKVTGMAFFISFFLPQALAFASNLPMASGSDTIAGYETVLTASGAFANEAVSFKVQKPDASVITVPTKADANGLAKADFSDYHTKTSGQYLVSAVLHSLETEKSSFQVYPDKISSTNSTLTVSRNIVKATGSDQGSLSVKLVDQYGNPFSGHQIHLISSRNQDQIVANTLNGLTDKNGVSTFSISSTESGISTFTALDVVSNTVLSGKAQIAFLKDDYSMSDIGGDNLFFQTAKADIGGSLNHFTFSDLPTTIQSGQNVSFRLTSADDSNQTVQNYTGKIHFSAEGSNGNNVTLPEDYTFKAEDLGTHQFSLGLSFSMAGTYKIIATALENPLFKGEQTVVIGSGNTNTSQQQSNGTLKPTLETPAAGTYSQKIQTISGSAPAGLTIKIFNNEQEIGSTQVDNTGKYAFQTLPLTDGIQKIYVVTVDSTQTVKSTSDTIQFSIDSTAPMVDDIVLKPNSGVKVGQVVTIDVTSEENLSQAAAVFNADITQLNASIDKPGHYLGSVQAPNASGIYPIDIILVDQLGNEGSYKAKTQLTISGNDGTVTEQVTQETQVVLPPATQETQQVLNPPPSKVSGVLSYAANKKVTLAWNAASDNSIVKHYRVYFGLNQANLDTYADTKDASTTWYVPNLDNGKEYYFSVSAFDDEGVESSSRSDIVSGIPFANEVSNLPKPVTPSSNIGGTDVLHGSADGGFSDHVADAGPELLWVFSGTGLVGMIVQKLRKKKTI